MLYHTGGCKNCVRDGFVEIYNISDNTWTVSKAFPKTKLTKNPEVVVQVCGFSEGYIFATFSEYENEGEDLTFHIYNTMEDVWTVSDTKLKREAYYPVSAVISKTLEG